MSILKEKIAKAISNHVSLEDTYTYELKRAKSAFEVGTMSLEDFEEWTEEDVDDLAKAIVDVLQPQLNENQQMLSGSELIGVIYSQLLEDFGFGYIEKDLWMIAENLSEKIANDQPQLNPSQQIVLGYLKEMIVGFDLCNAIYRLESAEDWGYSKEPHNNAYESLNDKQRREVVQVACQWALEQEAE